MLREAVFHQPESNYAFALDEKTVVIRIRTKKDDLLRCILFYGDRVCTQDPIYIKQMPMKKVGSDQLFDYYECVFVSKYTRICYYFRLEDENETLYYYGDEFHLSDQCSRTEYYQFAYVRREDIACVPPWSNSAVIYQIFPDSFATGKRYISGKGLQMKTESGKLCVSHNGGTLRGILENVDYLSELGINCIYLNPIFAASSYHKYDTIDYFTIDPCFGNREDLKSLVSVCHQNNIRVVLDGVFNHCGFEFFAFQDVLKNGINSRYADWFYHLEFPIKYEVPPNYEAFAYVREMPKLNTGNPEVAEYFCKVGTYWIREANIDGWRLDVANEIHHDFWRQFRKAIKAVKKDAFLIGEIWEDAGQWLQGDQLDSTMNYRFSNLCRDFFAQRSITARVFGEKLHAMVLRYKTPIAYAQMNLLDSHDVPRFLSKCGGDLQRLKLAIFFMMTFIGVPSVFYGDEAEIQGTTEPKYRCAMPWKDHPEQGELFQYIKELIALRKEYKALIYGGFQTAFADDGDVYVFVRWTDTEKLLIALNNSDEERTVNISAISPEADFCSVFPKSKEESIGAELKLSSMEGRIIRCDQNGE
ncbi:MAG TPA: alpha-glycosidase [Clostridiales bacterium]|nr:alpha-glycosidase [Clostridiales bacterium]